jgi:hypothetical protein
MKNLNQHRNYYYKKNSDGTVFLKLSPLLCRRGVFKMTTSRPHYFLQ